MRLPRIRARMGPLAPGRHPVSEPRWCSQHGRLECARPAHGGRTCHGSAVRDTAACRMHLGQAVDVVRRAQLTAWAATPDDDGISPRAAAAGQLGLAWRRAALLGEALRQQAETDAGPGDATTGGLVGFRYSASAAADGVYATGEAPRALVELEAAERDRVVRFAEAASRMGVEAEMTALARAHGDELLAILGAVLVDFGFDPADAAVRAVVVRRLRALTGSGDD
jgi:hypothetical protein